MKRKQEQNLKESKALNIGLRQVLRTAAAEQRDNQYKCTVAFTLSSSPSHTLAEEDST